MFFQFHLQYGVQLWGQKNQKIKQIMQKLQNRALKKINFKTFHHSIKHIYKNHNILKFTDILKVQNCLFMYQFKQNNALATYGKESVKYQCIRDRNNFKKKFPQIPENKLSNMKIKRILKQAIFDQCWTFYLPPSTSICAPCIIFTFYHQGLFNWHHSLWFY